MNRQIKFRAWDTKNNKWFMPDGGFSIHHLGYIIIENHKDKTTPVISLTQKDDGIVVMEFTGLKDKNGKEIYEGDIVKTFDTYFKPEIWSIQWSEKRNGWDLHYQNGQLKEMEVIGNIYENPELLKP